ncbi:DUF4258 domain-containing protein [Candidatus Uhrbacteria bacterium]|nr:DUF4258 domain-containing protein [Candidatus Uhrbacteria bacterium]
MPAKSPAKTLQKLLTRKPLIFTAHAQFKMRQYGLSPARVKRVLLYPARIEEGIAPKTVAVMQSASNYHPVLDKKPASAADANASVPRPRDCGSVAPANAAGGFRARKKNRSAKSELWVMYQDTKAVRKIIAAWRYPGVSPVRGPPPFPKDLFE